MADFDFIRLTFDDVSTSDLNLYVVSDGDRYTSYLTPQFENRTTSVPGRPGLLYWGTDLGVQEFSIRFATDGITGMELNKFKRTFQVGKIGKLSFEESFYKYYYVLLTSPPELSFLPFLTNEAKPQTLYKGEITLAFQTIEPYAESDYTFQTVAIQNSFNFTESGLKTISEFPDNTNVYFISNGHSVVNKVDQIGSRNLDSVTFFVYNAGNAPAPAKLSFEKIVDINAAEGSNPPATNWGDGALLIGDIRIIKPRFLRDIDLALATVYLNDGNWAQKREDAIIALSLELDGPAKSTIINIIDQYKEKIELNSMTQLIDIFKLAFCTNVRYEILVDGINKQNKLTVNGSKYFLPDSLVPVARNYVEDNAGQTNGVYLHVPPGGYTTVSDGQLQIISSETLSVVSINFKNTYI